MAFFLSNRNSFSSLGSQSTMLGMPMQARRGFHVELGEREKALLAEDPALKNFKSYKPTVRRIRKIGDVLTLVVFAACGYEILQHTIAKSSEHGK